MKCYIQFFYRNKQWPLDPCIANIIGKIIPSFLKQQFRDKLTSLLSHNFEIFFERSNYCTLRSHLTVLGTPDAREKYSLAGIEPSAKRAAPFVEVARRGEKRKKEGWFQK